ncbi:MAG TPA: hypothetical protein VGR53_03330 [Nitrososphaerales archaeon]|nr:hypothetical protein [Nitrososphaerales archaeon]
MTRRTVAALLILAVVVAGGVGYFVGSSSQPSLGRCAPWGSLRGFMPAGVNVTVAYQGNWRLSIAEFASNQTKASVLDSVCYYEGSGTISFYVSIANYQGWNTILALAHKYGTVGTLTVTIVAGPSERSLNSTASSYGEASTSLSFLR